MKLPTLLLGLAASLARAAPVRTDAAGVASCSDACAANWPALAAAEGEAGSGDLSSIGRADGSKQWADKGMALYGRAKDQKPGGYTGDGVKGVWHVARP
jgi:predicted lipoprotein with Yx(FWY)xxD motif